MIKPKYTQLISSCPAPLSFSFPVSSHHPIFLSSNFSICFLFILLISMPCKLPLPSGFPTHHNSFSESAKKISEIFHSKFNPKCSSFQETLCTDNLSLERTGVEWITPELSIESIIQFNKGQMSLKVKTFISKSHCSKFPDLS